MLRPAGAITALGLRCRDTRREPSFDKTLAAQRRVDRGCRGMPVEGCTKKFGEAGGCRDGIGQCVSVNNGEDLDVSVALEPGLGSDQMTRIGLLQRTVAYLRTVTPEPSEHRALRGQDFVEAAMHEYEPVVLGLGQIGD